MWVGWCGCAAPFGGVARAGCAFSVVTMGFSTIAACNVVEEPDSADEKIGVDPCACENIPLPTAPVLTEAELLALLVAARDVAWPELAALNLAVDDETDLAYFRASISTDTALEPDNANRVFVVSYDPVVLADPPDPASLAAILVHELAHVHDYTQMDVETYLEFGLWYGAQDPKTSDELAEYERSTDEAAMSRGCAAGLSTMRAWIYAHASAEVLAEKQRNYYTPAEIAEWVAVNSVCSSG